MSAKTRRRLIILRTPGKSAGGQIKQKAGLGCPKRAQFFIQRTELVKVVHTKGGDIQEKSIFTQMNILNPAQARHLCEQSMKSFPVAMRNMAMKVERRHWPKGKAQMANRKFQ